MVVFVCYYRITAATLTPHREILEELLTKCEGRYSVVTVEQPNMELLQRIDQMASENWRDFLQPETSIFRSVTVTLQFDITMQNM